MKAAALLKHKEKLTPPPSKQKSKPTWEDRVDYWLSALDDEKRALTAKKQLTALRNTAPEDAQDIVAEIARRYPND